MNSRAGSSKGGSGAYRHSEILDKAESNRTAGYGTVGPVVLEDDEDGNIPASYPINFGTEARRLNVYWIQSSAYSASATRNGGCGLTAFLGSVP